VFRANSRPALIKLKKVFKMIKLINKYINCLSKQIEEYLKEDKIQILKIVIYSWMYILVIWSPRRSGRREKYIERNIAKILNFE
jgi:hypothetical protein